MALLVSDTRQEEFSKPPPKKKWLAEYIEKDSAAQEDTVAAAATSITENLSTEAREFVRLFDKSTDQINYNSLKQLYEQKAGKGNMTVSQDVIGGVVQGVLDQFQTFFEASCSQASSQAFKINPTNEEQKLTRLLDPAKNGDKFNASLKRLSAKPEEAVEQQARLEQHHITPVVQSVISQFLNGSLEDVERRRSRKRSHKHSSCRHQGDCDSSSAKARARRSSSVIMYKSREREEIKEELPLQHDENEALNLSLPKLVHSKVTFAARDRCYTTDFPSVSSFQPSQSEVLSIQESRISPVPHLIPHPFWNDLF